MREDLLIPWLIPDFCSHLWTLFATIYLKVFFVHCAITETIRRNGLHCGLLVVKLEH